MAETKFELVFKRGGTSPAELKSTHASLPAAEQAASQEARRQRDRGHTKVWLAYDVWEIPPAGRRRRVRRDVVLQRPS